VYETYVGQGMYPKSGQPPITPESFKQSETFYRALGGWGDEQSDEIVAYDLVDTGSGTAR
jgi:3-mercaptopyruvate sulfurtransferase SseA